MPEVARRTGFNSEVTMRQHFASRLAISPRAYRASFAAGGSACHRFLPGADAAE
jgi:transcriptional regulator GlxA family with amidase domain